MMDLSFGQFSYAVNGTGEFIKADICKTFFGNVIRPGPFEPFLVSFPEEVFVFEPFAHFEANLFIGFGLFIWLTLLMQRNG